MKNTRSAEFCADWIAVMTNFAVKCRYKEGSLYQTFFLIMLAEIVSNFNFE